MMFARRLIYSSSRSPLARRLLNRSVGCYSHRSFSNAPEAGTSTLEPVGLNPFGGSKLITSPFDIICNDPTKVQQVLGADAKFVRNFSIIAHIDHGKSTLADRMLEFSGNLAFSGGNKQVLDFLEVEKQRGITVKAQTASMFFQNTDSQNPGNYLLNLIDTPGHVDFSYEVSRSLAACQGVLLLVDATQGVQAQTLANFYLALEAELDVIPIISKMDLPTANADAVAVQMENAFGVDRSDIIRISAKTGVGVADIFPQVIRRIRAPPEMSAIRPARMLLFDSWFDQHRGVIAVFKIVDGELKRGDFIASYHSGAKYEVSELGLLMPHRYAVDSLKSGQVGYVVAGIKNSREVRTGDTFYTCDERDKPVATPSSITALPGFKPAKSMVYAGLYPVSADDFEQLNEALLKLTLNDASVSVAKESSVALGQGFRCGFLGVLHMEGMLLSLSIYFFSLFCHSQKILDIFQCFINDWRTNSVRRSSPLRRPCRTSALCVTALCS
jgi:GTP-binding protein LepA